MNTGTVGWERRDAIMQAAKNLDAHLTESNDFMTEDKSSRGPVAQGVPQTASAAQTSALSIFITQCY